MNIQKFLDLSSGRWFSQRTNYFLSENKSESSKADITIEFIPPDDSKAIALCEQNHLDSNLIVGGTVQSWDNSVDWGKTKQIGSATLVLVADEQDDRTGKLIRQGSKCGRYALGEDSALTLVFESDQIYAEERQWFASDNFKMRTIVVKYNDGRKQTSFYSEIRKAPVQDEG
jgi:phycoerythrin-associated linker protein